MAGRGRFKVPSAKELDENTTNVKPKSLFEAYKSNKTKPLENSVGGSSGKKPSSSSSNLKASTSSSVPGKKQSSSSSSTCLVASTSSSVPQPSSKNIKLPSASSASSSSSSSDSGSKGLERPTTVSSSTNEQTGPPAAASKQTSSNSIIVSYRQRGNPILKHIRNVTWEYGSIVPDYVMGKANCALFLSLRYHQMNPQYLHNRLKELGRGYDLRVLLVQVDVKDPHHLLKDLAKICILADCTLMLAFSAEEAGRYLEAYKVYENKPAEALMEKTDTDYISKVTECLTTVKSVNKTDCLTLATNFKSMEGIINTNKEDLSLCAGFGPQKAARLYNVLHEPFLKIRKRANKPGSENSPSTVKKPS